MCAMLSLDAFKALTSSQQHDYFDSLTVGKMRAPKPMSNLSDPDWLPFLYCNAIFPTFHSTKLQCSVETGHRLLVGSLKLQEKDLQLTMVWVGYASQLFDGQLCLFVVEPNAHIIGTINDQEFTMEGTRLVRGKWPGFLVMYQ